MQTKFVKIVSVTVTDPQALMVGKMARVVAEDGTTTTKDWFTGPNAWGFHNDLRFTQNLGTIRQSMRIMEAIEKAVANAAPAELLAEDHAMLLEVLKAPSRHQNTTPPSVQLLRAILPILVAVEEATDQPPV